MNDFMIINYVRNDKVLFGYELFLDVNIAWDNVSQTTLYIDILILEVASRIGISLNK